MKLDMNRRIASKLKAFEKAQRALADQILAQQRNCKHEVVWEIPWQSIGIAGGLKARRMCVHCRYEEEGSHWSGGSTWSRQHKDGMPIFDAVLGNDSTRAFAPTISREEFYRNRLPTRVPDYVELDFAEVARAKAAKFPFMACPTKSDPLDPLERCGSCGGSGSHQSIPNPDFRSPDPSPRDRILHLIIPSWRLF